MLYNANLGSIKLPSGNSYQPEKMWYFTGANGFEMYLQELHMTIIMLRKHV